MLVSQLADTWQSITDWLYKPFQQQQDPINWLLLCAIAAAIAYGWKLILDNVLEQ